MIRGERRRLAAGAIVFGVLLLHVVLQLRVTTDITHFLPGGEPDSRIELARRIATGELSRTMVLLVDAEDQDEAVAVSRAFERELRAEPRVAAALASLEGGPPPGVEQAIWEVYQPRRLAFLAADAGAARARIDDAGVAAAVAALKQRLASPMSALVSRTAPADPFLVLPALFERANSGTAGGIGTAGERFVTTEGAGAVLFLTTRASASDSTVQRPLLAGIDAAFAAVRAQHGDHLRLSQSGANRHAIAAEDSMRADMERVSTLSLLGIVAVYLLLFRSLQPFLLSLPVLGAGFLAGTSTCLLVHGQIHGLTLAFGAALLGVAIDYSLHFFSHLALAPDPRGPRATLQRIWHSLSLCTATTVVGFLALLLAAFPGLRELALFASTGLAGSLAATWLLLPGLARPVRPTRLTLAIVGAIDRLTHARGAVRRLLLLPVIAVTAVIAIGMPSARWDDGIGGLNRVDPELRAEDDAVRARTAPFEQRRVVVATGADEQAALAVNDRVAAVLDAAAAAGEIDGAAGIAHLLPSAARQREVDAVVRGDATLWPRLEAALGDAGFVSSAFAPFARDLAAPAPPPLVPENLLGTPLEPLVRPFRDQGPQGPIVLSFLRGVRDEAALQSRLDAVDGAVLIDIERTLTSALGDYRQRMTEMLLIGVFAVVGLVLLRQRAVRPTLIACLPPLLAAAGTAATLALLGMPVHLMSLMALLMVVSMGDDYGIFLVEDDAPDARRATHLSVVLSSLTTVLGFGLLSLSQQPALHAIGLTATIGIGWCVLLALSTGALFVPPRPAANAPADDAAPPAAVSCGARSPES